VSTTAGVGTDIVSVPRVGKLLRDGGPEFLQRWFTAEEVAYCSSKAEPDRHFAARIAGKEAVIKALEWEWDGPIIWRCIEIAHTGTGAPVVRLSGRVLEVAQQLGMCTIRVSLSHCDDFATAVAVLDVEA
jgi:holo-[acyl-carrier protein] synthase